MYMYCRINLPVLSHQCMYTATSTYNQRTCTATSMYTQNTRSEIYSHIIINVSLYYQTSTAISNSLTSSPNSSSGLDNVVNTLFEKDFF